MLFCSCEAATERAFYPCPPSASFTHIQSSFVTQFTSFSGISSHIDCLFSCLALCFVNQCQPTDCISYKDRQSCTQQVNYHYIEQIGSF